MHTFNYMLCNYSTYNSVFFKKDSSSVQLTWERDTASTDTVPVSLLAVDFGGMGGCTAGGSFCC